MERVEWMMVLMMEGQQPYVLGRNWPSYETCVGATVYTVTEPSIAIKREKKRRVDNPNGSYQPLEKLEIQAKAHEELFNNLRCLPYNEY